MQIDEDDEDDGSDGDNEDEVDDCLHTGTVQHCAKKCKDGELGRGDLCDQKPRG